LASVNHEYACRVTSGNSHLRLASISTKGSRRGFDQMVEIRQTFAKTMRPNRNWTQLWIPAVIDGVCPHDFVESGIKATLIQYGGKSHKALVAARYYNKTALSNYNNPNISFASTTLVLKYRYLFRDRGLNQLLQIFVKHHT